MAFTLKSKFTVLAGAYLALRENAALHLFNQNARFQQTLVQQIDTKNLLERVGKINNKLHSTSRETGKNRCMWNICHFVSRAKSCINAVSVK